MSHQNGQSYMGGRPGDGTMPSSSQQWSSPPAGTAAGSHGGVSAANGGYAGGGSYQPQPQLQQQQQQQQQYQQQARPPPGSGSITQYAPQAQAAPSTQQQQQQQQQQPAASGGGTFAERSARAHAAAGSSIPSPQPQPQASSAAPGATASAAAASPGYSKDDPKNPAVLAYQNRIITEATRNVQEHSYYMRQAMDKDDLPTVLDRAAHMVGELGDSHHHSSHHHHHHHGHSHGGGASDLTPKNYYELHMRALDDMPNLEEYFLNLTQHPPPMDHHPNAHLMSMNQESMVPRYTMKEMYHAVQYCPRALPRLYLQICAGSSLIRSKEAGAKWVLNDLIESVKCVQCPIRGLFLRHFLLQVVRDKLPDNPVQDSLSAEGEPLSTGEEGKEEGGTSKEENIEEIDEMDPGTVKDAYEFVLANFIEMNKLWVRIQHLPGEGKSKEQRKQRERERNELRILVGTNLVRLSQLEGVTSKIYGEIILPKILEQIVACRDALAQAYLIDCIIQVFPDEYHIETLSIFLGVCPKLRDKVNIRTILQSLMDRLGNYYAEEVLLDEADTNEVKKHMAQDSFIMFEECVQNVYNARGPKLSPKEVIRLQTALLNFSLKCYPGNMDQVNRCLGVCVAFIRQASTPGPYADGTPSGPDNQQLAKKLDEAAITELEKLLSIPLDSLALQVLELDHYSDLLMWLPWENRRDVALTMVKAIDTAGRTPRDVKEIEELFNIIAPVIRDESATSPTSQERGGGVDRTADLLAGLGVDKPASSLSFGASFNETDPQSYHRLREIQEENNLVSKLVHLMYHEDTDIAYEMLSVARKHLGTGGKLRAGHTLVPVAFSTLRLAERVYVLEYKASKPVEKTVELEEAVESKDKGEEGEKGTEGEKENSSLENESGESASKQTSLDAISLEKDTPAAPPPFSKSIRCRKIFGFLQQTIATLAKGNAEMAIKLYLQSALTADKFADVNEKGEVGIAEFSAISYELVTQAFILHEEEISDSKIQQRCIVAMIGALLSCRSLGKDDYESLITKTAQYAAKMLKKPDQCQMVAMCSYLFYRGEKEDASAYRNAQRVLECLQRALKIADACTMASSANVGLFVDLLEHYVYFFEKENPLITDKYITGLTALIKEHLTNIGPLGESAATADAKAHFNCIVKYLMKKKSDPETREKFGAIDCGTTM